MPKAFIAVSLLLLAGCNEVTNVAVITNFFSHSPEFEARGLRLSVFRMSEVIDTMQDDYGIEVGPPGLVPDYVKAVNKLPTGTVVLHYPGGYQAAYDALSKHPGRKIYCSTQYGEIPDGCIPIGLMWDFLNTIAPISSAEYQAAQAPQERYFVNAIVGPGHALLSPDTQAIANTQLSRFYGFELGSVTVNPEFVGFKQYDVEVNVRFNGREIEIKQLNLETFVYWFDPHPSNEIDCSSLDFITLLSVVIDESGVRGYRESTSCTLHYGLEGNPYEDWRLGDGLMTGEEAAEKVGRFE